ncbi:hypothetical protein HYT02_02880 [Candidatus Gottesmanbacteria bacterium]|nr:hypothetical protein [Candidatus Gottesmanbacteria bacterium]
MNKNYDLSNTKESNSQFMQTQADITQNSIKNTSDKHLQSNPKQISKKWLILVLLVLLLSTVGYLLYKDFQTVRQQAYQNQLTITPTITPSAPSPTSTNQVIEPTSEIPATFTNNFNFNNFSIRYPDDWSLLDLETSEDFPLKERFANLNIQGRTIALKRDGLYIIITVEEENKGQAGGIFFNEDEYNKFLTNKDKVVIGDSTYYLNKENNAISTLQESDSGPYGWSSLAEYIPNKSASGNSYKGYENVIKKNGYQYNFIVVSNEGGQTNPEIQSEMISIFNSITW